MSIVVCNNKRRRRGVLEKNANRCLNRRKDNIDAAPLMVVQSRKDQDSKKNSFFYIPH